MPRMGFAAVFDKKHASLTNRAGVDCHPLAGITGAAAHQARHVKDGDDEIITPLDLGAVPTFTAVASNNIKHSNDAERSTIVASYVKLKEIVLGQDLPGCRVFFELLNTLGDTNAAYARIYKNGEAVGIERGTFSTEYVEFQEDFTGWLEGDLIQIYGRRPDAGTTQVVNMRLAYDLEQTGHHTDQDP